MCESVVRRCLQVVKDQREMDRITAREKRKKEVKERRKTNRKKRMKRLEGDGKQRERRKEKTGEDI